MTATFVLHRGDSPLVVSAPHVGTYVPAAILGRLTPEAAELADTDWHVERLYEFARDLGASTIAATHSRLVVVLIRDPSGKPLYPGASNTEICPLGTFADGPVYRDGTAPDEAEIARRQQVEADLARYLPREVAERVARGEASLSLGGARRPVTVLFADVAAFTSFPDHHAYPPADLDRLALRMPTGVDLVVTTLKDLVKLDRPTLGDVPIVALEIALEPLVGAEAVGAAIDAAAPVARGAAAP
jgi:hypothetical protein